MPAVDHDGGRHYLDLALIMIRVVVLLLGSLLLGNVNSSIPNGTRIVIFQPGGNDRRVSRKHPQIANTRENIETIVRILLDRKIIVLFSGSPEKRGYVQGFSIPTIDKINQLAPDRASSRVARSFVLVADRLRMC